MEVTALPPGSFVNLRAYRCAADLAQDLFWITRRFPQAEQAALTGPLRRTARAISVHVMQGWNRRYHGPAFRAHLGEAHTACSRLGQWLDRAYERRYLSDDEHEALRAREAELHCMLRRLRDQRIAMLA